jgi:Nucleotidyl transferase AbiEii toxin, Type IV TA system
MISRANITAWRKTAPWPNDPQVEQDLILSRVITEIFSLPIVAHQMVFRGGTALHKLYFEPPGRYSEDIDLVQRDPGPIEKFRDRGGCLSFDFRLLVNWCLRWWLISNSRSLRPGLVFLQWQASRLSQRGSLFLLPKQG